MRAGQRFIFGCARSAGNVFEGTEPTTGVAGDRSVRTLAVIAMCTAGTVHSRVLVNPIFIGPVHAPTV